MAKKNMTEMGRKELENHLAEVEAALAAYDERRKMELLTSIEDDLAKEGYTIEEVFGVQPKKPKGSRGSKGKLAPKYRDPEQQDRTWSGKGRRPKWVIEHIEAGGELEELAI